jgi:prolyl-tRNA editing enzyme YbaK/EbsC (Cys-tRNA(Pro) deacylase)
MDAAMATPHDDLVRHLRAAFPGLRIYEHRESRTSEESFRARAAAGAGWVIGARAILMKVDLEGAVAPHTFALFVLPGNHRIDSRQLKTALREFLPEARAHRLATTDEMAAHARGMQPGTMPPFGRPVFPEVGPVFVASALTEHGELGFNAARLDRSIVMRTADYLACARHRGVFAFTAPQETVAARPSGRAR